MATQNQPPKKNSRNDTVECPNCHELYSTTYRRCPFCRELAVMPTRRSESPRSSQSQSPRSSQPQRTSDGRSRKPDSNQHPRSTTTNRDSRDSRGRRVARTTRGGGYGKPAYLNQIIFIAITLALIIAACWVVGKTIGPLLGSKSDKDPDTSTSTTVEPDTTDEFIIPEVEEPVEEEPVVSDVIAITLSSSDVTLPGGDSFTLTVTTTPADAEGTIVWTTDNSSALSVSLAGVVTNTNTGSSTVPVTVTATIGDVSASCIVRCKPSSSTTASTTATSGANATVNASGGLNVRSSPSTDGTLLSSLANNSRITIISSASDDWYEIYFVNSSGTEQAGYVSKSYVIAD